jgi:hypothetical protein
MPSPPGLSDHEPSETTLPRWPSREAIGFSLAYLDGDDALAGEILAAYSFSAEQVQFVAALAALVETARPDREGFRETLYHVARAKAAQ